MPGTTSEPLDKSSENLTALVCFPFPFGHFIIDFTCKCSDVPVYISLNMYQKEKYFEQML
jgi:hypothetical protein